MVKDQRLELSMIRKMSQISHKMAHQKKNKEVGIDRAESLTLHFRLKCSKPQIVHIFNIFEAREGLCIVL